MRGRYAALSILALVLGVGGGVLVEQERTRAAMEAADAGPQILYWVAPMDPNFRKEGPGKSPMGMDLVPVYEGDEPIGDTGNVMLSATEVNSIGVRTAVAQMQDVARRIETVGFVAYDEHEISHIHTRVEGWIERLEVRAEGDPVRQGELLFELYAPEITIASSELMRAVQRQDADEEQIARTKLMNFGVSERQIEEMARAQTTAKRIRYYAPQDGVVLGLNAADGMYLQPNTRALTLGDLSTVWVIVDVFERDLALLSADMKAEARFDHLPERPLEGKVDYIFPELDATTRTLRVRLRFDNADGMLKPNMFANVTLIPKQVRQAVTVPSEAVIRTGRAERVILKTDEGTFRPRLVNTGLRSGFGEGGRTEIVQGLAPGDEVVASAQFLIDSESALNAGMLRFAPTEAAPVEAKGTLVSLDRKARRAVIAHDEIADLDWPPLTSPFTIRYDVALDDLSEGQAVRFKVFRGADGLVAISDIGDDDGVDASGTGMVHAVTPDGKLTISHDPIPALGWPSMRMDMDVEGLETDEIPLETPIEFDLAEGDGGLYVIVGLRAAAETDELPPEPKTSQEKADQVPPIVVYGVIRSVDAATRQATIAHGPIAEIGMPGMMMDFALDESLDPSDLPLDKDLSLTFARPDGMTMVLTAVEAKAIPIMVTGTINSVDVNAATANITHGPITEIGMPGMTMNFPLDDALDPESLPIGQKTGVLLRQGDDLSLTVIGIEEGAS
ncbi:efflux RND transporter periplasmic adaptor subunit [Roseovarius aestuariivivens]|uniref:efflux RND transporter periplasmic adaptor subunit n=1 Tax=Roseovarius aestuariivivens TaxID=1888910 RepID=UPI0010821AB1|nr:efflux RND transporter periplasmic adaptor subunit [Roseovarius aestuariivivens]